MKERRVTQSKLFFAFLFILHASTTCTIATDTLSANQTIRFNQTIVSPEQTFELGFFNPGNSTNHYIGIWYKKISTGTVVWVANRNAPVNDTSGELTLTLNGVLVLRDATTGRIVWSSSNSSTTSVRNPIARLLDTGNFIISDDDDTNQENPIWQSFDFLTDTLLPGMKHGWNFVTGIERVYTSWKSDNDPSSGEFSKVMDIRGYPQQIVMHGQAIQFRIGPWNGLRFTGARNLKENRFYNYTFVFNQNEVYYQYNLKNPSIFMRLVMQQSGRVERLLWIDRTREWTLYSSSQVDRCDDQYAMCGPFGNCNMDSSPVCECLKGFEPASPDQWSVGDWSKGCRSSTPLTCDPREGFNKYSSLKLPDTRGSWYNRTMNLVECEKVCKSNCSCSAYTSLNISGAGSGCLLWFGDLIDIRTFADGGDTLYVRLPASELEYSRSLNAWRRVRIPVAATSVGLVIIVSLCLFYYFYKKKQQATKGHPEMNQDLTLNRSGDDDLELPLFSLSTLLKSTNGFSFNNKLGEGGFGVVYKGVLEDGQELAVKRLAKTSTQGLHEFRNEVILISKLQHRNLVKLLGYYMDVDEKMLVYEYLPNKGLDSFIFDRTQSEQLDWLTRYKIIIGIARGLLYLHQDSRLRIIHRDLKVSNILLDMDMNPKISDFGMARIFQGNQLEANTKRVVGTYGYMAPEYAGVGLFSIKSDVYSFGIIVLEIVCGEKNKGYVHNEYFNNLAGHAWVLHNEGRPLELVAKCLGKSIIVSQVLRLIHVALLCVQRHPKNRPTMTSVIRMLESEGQLPFPEKPGFYIGKSKKDSPESLTSYGSSSNNELSISMLNGR